MIFRASFSRFVVASTVEFIRFCERHSEPLRYNGIAAARVYVLVVISTFFLFFPSTFFHLELCHWRNWFCREMCLCVWLCELPMVCACGWARGCQYWTMLANQCVCGKSNKLKLFTFSDCCWSCSLPSDPFASFSEYFSLFLFVLGVRVSVCAAIRIY